MLTLMISTIILQPQGYFLNDHPDFLGLDDAARLAEAKGYLTMSALDDFDAAIDEINAESDTQGDDLVTLGCLSSGGSSRRTGENLTEIRDSIQNGATMVGDSTLDLKEFFDTGVDFRSPASLLPPFTGNAATGLFPDPTFDGVVLQSP